MLLDNINDYSMDYFCDKHKRIRQHFNHKSLTYNRCCVRLYR